MLSPQTTIRSPAPCATSTNLNLPEAPMPVPLRQSTSENEISTSEGRGAVKNRRGKQPRGTGAAQGQRRRRPRRWCIPALAFHEPGEFLEGAELLREYDGVLGMILWQTVRDVALWAAAPRAARGVLFGTPGHVAFEGASVPPKISGPLATVGEFLHAPPEKVDRDLLALACMEISTWARQAHTRRTALAYAEAAALASPRLPGAAVLAGSCAIEAEEPFRAEGWLRRAVWVARRERDRDAFATGFFLMGRVAELQGYGNRAKELYSRAFREGRRRRIRLVRRDAAYALFRLARDRPADRATASEFALAAQHAHVPGQPDAAPMLLDLARFWVDENDERRARIVLRRLVAHFGELTGEAALAAVGLVARVYVATERQGAADAATHALAMMRNHPAPDEITVQAAMDVAYGAAARRDRECIDQAQRLAERYAAPAAYCRTRDELAKLAATAFQLE